MAYNKFNKLKRIIEVQKHFKLHYQPGMTIEHIYKYHVYPTFKISRTTFFEWMKVNAETQLKDLQDGKGKTELKQLSMEFDNQAN